MTAFDELEELLHEQTCTPERVCKVLARLFEVRASEVGMLFVAVDHLSFLYPPELQSAGTIPLSSNAVSARTAVTRTPEIFNRFVTVPHHDVFEAVKINDAEDSDASVLSRIQKLMSAPLIGDDDVVLGVIQICRKGTDPVAAGADFSADDLETLVRAARRVALMLPDLQAARQTSRQILRFHNTNARKSIMAPR